MKRTNWSICQGRMEYPNTREGETESVGKVYVLQWLMAESNMYRSLCEGVSGHRHMGRDCRCILVLCKGGRERDGKGCIENKRAGKGKEGKEGKGC